MNLRNEIEKIKNEENNNKKSLADITLKWLNNLDITENEYDLIIDELQRGIDNRLDLTEMEIYCKDLDEIINTKENIPEELKLFLREYKEYQTIKKLNAFLNECEIDNVLDEYNYEDIKNIVYKLYDNKVNWKFFFNKIYGKVEDVNNLFDMLSYIFDYKNKYINLENHNPFYWPIELIIKHDLESKDFVFLRDYSCLNEASYQKISAVTKVLEKSGIYLYNFLKHNNQITCDYNLLAFTLDDTSVGFDKLRNNKKSFLFKIMNESDKGFVLSLRYFVNFVAELKKVLDVGKIEEIPFRHDVRNLSERLQERYVLNENYCYNLLLNIINQRIIEVKSSNIIPFKDKIKIYIPQYGKILLFFRRYFAIISIDEERQGTTRIIKGWKSEYHYLGDLDFYKIKIDDEEFCANLNVFSEYNETRGKANVWQRAAVGTLLGGAGGAVIGAASAIEKNNSINKRQEIKNSTILKNIKYKNVMITLYCSNLWDSVNLFIYDFNVKKEIVDDLLKTIEDAFSKPYSYEEDKIIYLDEIKKVKRNLQTKLKEIDKQLDECNNTIATYKDGFFAIGKKYKIRSEAINLKEKLEKEKEQILNFFYKMDMDDKDPDIQLK